MKFVLLLTLWSHDDGPQVDVLDSDLTGKDCIAAMVELRPLEGYGYSLSCEFDHGE